MYFEKLHRGIAISAILLVMTAFPSMSMAGEDKLKLSFGKFHTFASGTERAYSISGNATMLKTASKRTVVDVKVRGLHPNTNYPAHVHNKPCGISNGGGHYQQIVGGPVDNVNEIWPTLVVNNSGTGLGYAKNDFYARSEAQSIVIHDTDGARIACADLVKLKVKLKKDKDKYKYKYKYKDDDDDDD